MRRSLLLAGALALACAGAAPQPRHDPAGDDEGTAPASSDAGEVDRAAPAPAPDVRDPTPLDAERPAADRTSAAPDAPPAAGKTVCLNADGPGGEDAYALVYRVLGPDALDNFPDNLHMPPVRHLREEVDDVVGPHFVALIHRDIDLDHLQNDRQRVEITVHAPGPARLKGQDGLTLTYSWRFKFAPNLKTSSAFSIFFQLKSEGGNWSAPIVALTAHGNNLEIHQIGNDGASHTLAGTAFLPLRGLWLEGFARATFSHQGAFYMTVKKPDGTTVLEANAPHADMWRDGDFTKPKWGIYRSLNDRGALNASEDTVAFANIGITAGATPDSTCR
jgi:hypothetical protein